MAGRRTKTFRHPLWELMLLMAADADKTGLTEEDARNLLKKWMPSMAPYVDAVMEATGDIALLPEDANMATFDALNAEEAALTRSQIDRALAGETGQAPESGGRNTTANGNDGDFSARLRREIGAKRDAAGRATVEMGD